MFWQTLSFLAVPLNDNRNQNLQVPTGTNLLELMRIDPSQSCTISLRSNNDKTILMEGFNPLATNTDANVPICYPCKTNDTFIVTLTSLVAPGPASFYLNFWFRFKG